MPNWCTNIVTIETDDPELTNRFKSILNSNQDIFNQLVPRPHEYDDDSKWYAWNTENWGTKWDATPSNIKWKENQVSFQIDTAWSPPINFYTNIEKLGYKVDAYYLEEGMGILGHFFAGKDNSIEYIDLTLEQMENELPPWVENVFGLVSSKREQQEEEQELAQLEYEKTWERTVWYPNKIKPIRDGIYEVRTYFSKTKLSPPLKLEWKKNKWVLDYKVADWRGITEKQKNLL